MLSPEVIYNKRFSLGFYRERPIGAVSLDITYSNRSAVVLSIPNKLRRRLVARNVAINTQTLEKHKIPEKVYIYPSQDPEPPFTNSISLGVLIKQMNLFIPITSLTSVRKEDVERLLLALQEPRTLDVHKILDMLGIRVRGEYHTRQGSGLKLYDPELDLTYDVVIEGLTVISTNICVEEGLSLIDLILLVRDMGGDVHLYEPLF